MHYIPDPRYEDDDESDSQTIGSKLSGKFLSKKAGRRPPNNTDSASSTSRPSTNQKAKKKLGKLIKRTFAKHKPAPSAAAALHSSTSGGGGSPPAVLTERDALLERDIHCDTNAADSPSVTLDSQSVFSGHTPPNIRQNEPLTRKHSQPQQLHATSAAPSLKSRPTTSPTTAALDSSSSSDDEYFDQVQETQEKRDRRIEKAQKKIQANMEYSVWQCVVAIFLYVVVSVVFFSCLLEKDWTFLDSSYFAVVTFTTIGYGDVVPDYVDARLFTCVWALSGVSCLGIALGVLGSNMIAVHEEQMERAKTQRQTSVIGFLDTSSSGGRRMNDPLYLGYNTLEEGKRRAMYDIFDDSDDENNKRWNQHQKKQDGKCCGWACSIPAIWIRVVVLLVFFVGLLYLISHSEGWDIVTTVYYAIITASTVGYGDFAPKTPSGRLYAVIFIPFAVGIMGTFLEAVANAIIDRRRNQYQAYLTNKPLTLRDIRLLDSDGDGEVTRAEYLEFMLVAMNQVDKGLLEKLKDHFNRLDYDQSGTINKDDLTEMARQGSYRLAHHKDYLSHSTSPPSAS